MIDAAPEEFLDDSSMTNRLLNDTFDMFWLYTTIPDTLSCQRTCEWSFVVSHTSIAFVHDRLLRDFVLGISTAMFTLEWIDLVIWRDVYDDISCPLVASDV